jgi:hypothetical protein
MHEWEYLATTMGAGPDTTSVGLLAIVCQRCGVIRAEAIAPGSETQIRLDGQCPGASPETRR